MNNGLEELSKFRKFLTKYCKHLNTGSSPVFISVSLIAGIILIAGGVLLAPKSIIGHVCIGIGAITTVVNAVQLIYKKYI